MANNTGPGPNSTRSDNNDDNNTAGMVAPGPGNTSGPNTGGLNQPPRNNQQGLADQKVRMVNSGGRQVAMHRHPGYPKGSKNGQWHPVERRHGSLGRTAQIHMEAGLGKDGYGQAGERPLGAPRPKEDPKGLMGETGAKIGEATSKVTGAMDRVAQDTAQTHPNVSRFLDMASTGAKLSGVGARAVGRLALGSFGDVGAKGMQMMTNAMRALLSGDPMTASGRLVTQALGDISSMESTLQQSAARYGLVTDADAQTIADTVQGSMYNKEARAFEQGMNAGMENISQELMNAGVTDVSQMGAAQLPVFKDALEGHIERVAQMISDGVDSDGRVLGLNDLQRLKAEMDVYGSVTDGLASRVKSAREESRVATARLTASRALEAGLRQEARRAAREQAEAGRQARMQAAEQARADGDVIPHTILTQMGYNVAVGDDGLPIQRGKLTRLENILQDQLRVLSPDGDPEEIAMVQDALNRVGEERRRQRFMDRQYASLQNQRYRSEYGELEEAEGIASPGRRSARAEEERPQPRTAHEEMFGMGGTDRDNYADVMTTMSNAKKRRAMDQRVASRIDDMENMEVEMPDGTVRVRTLEELQQDPEYQALNHYRAFSANAELVDGLMNHINRIKPDALDLIGKDQRDVAEEKAKLEQLLYANFKAHNFMPDGEGSVRALGGMPEAGQDLELITWANNMGHEYKKDIADAKKKEMAKKRAAETKQKHREAEWRADLSVDTAQRRADIGVEAARQKGQSKIHTTGQVEGIKTAAENQRNISRRNTEEAIIDARTKAKIKEAKETGEVKAKLTTLNTNEKIRYEREAAKEHIKRRIADLTAQRGITKEQAARLVMKEEHTQKMGEIKNKMLSDEFNIRFDDLVRTNQEGLRMQKDLQELQRIAYGLEQGHQASMNDIELKHLAGRYGLDLSQQASVQKLELDNLIAKLDAQMKFNDEEREKHATALADEFGLNIDQAKQLAMVDDVRLGRKYLRELAYLDAQRELADHFASLGFNGVPVTPTLGSLPVVAGGSQNMVTALAGGSGQGEVVDSSAVDTEGTIEGPPKRKSWGGRNVYTARELDDVGDQSLTEEERSYKDFRRIFMDGNVSEDERERNINNFLDAYSKTYGDEKADALLNRALREWNASEDEKRGKVYYNETGEDLAGDTEQYVYNLDQFASNEEAQKAYLGATSDYKGLDGLLATDRNGNASFLKPNGKSISTGKNRLADIFNEDENGNSLYKDIQNTIYNELNLANLAAQAGRMDEANDFINNVSQIDTTLNQQIKKYEKWLETKGLDDKENLLRIKDMVGDFKSKTDLTIEALQSTYPPLVRNARKDAETAKKIFSGDWTSGKVDRKVAGTQSYKAFSRVPDLEKGLETYLSNGFDAKSKVDFEDEVKAVATTLNSDWNHNRSYMSEANRNAIEERKNSVDNILAQMKNHTGSIEAKEKEEQTAAGKILEGKPFTEKFRDTLSTMADPNKEFRTGEGIAKWLGITEDNPKGDPEQWALFNVINSTANRLSNLSQKNSQELYDVLSDSEKRREIEKDLTVLTMFATDALGPNDDYSILSKEKGEPGQDEQKQGWKQNVSTLAGTKDRNKSKTRNYSNLGAALRSVITNMATKLDMDMYKPPEETA